MLTWAGLVWERPDPTVGWDTVVLEFLVAGPADSCMRPCAYIPGVNTGAGQDFSLPALWVTLVGALALKTRR